TWLRIPLDRPRLTLILLAVLSAIFMLMTVLGGSINATENADLLVKWGAKVNGRVYQGEWWRLITSTFLHAGILHIFLNGSALYFIGMDLEAFVGKARFAAVYAISGLGGSVASFIFSPFNVPGVGASGAIFGLIGALAVYFGLHRRLLGARGNAQFRSILLVIVLNLGFGFSGILPIDNSAHLGGLIAGVASGFVLCPRYDFGRWSLPNIREAVDANRGSLQWVAAVLIALDIVFIFFVALLMIRTGIWVPVR
ncbi:MAG TPA: rhomboid family intramembrane serine protease, partial [Chloroflexia bacterium]|nr:rhomboid family intramembrane serine protease [Chloroflexia bacterium]